MPFASRECRWFLDEPLADAVEERFRRAGSWPQKAPIPGPEWPDGWRVDHYLLFPGREDLNLKSRGGSPDAATPTRLEFKGRTTDLGAHNFGPRAAGRVEHWVKWSCAGDEIPDSLRPLVDRAGSKAASDLVRVEKQRLLRRLRLDPAGADVEIPLNGSHADLDRGLQIELTRLRVDNHPAGWTLAFEAFPLDDALAADFDRSVARFLADFSSDLPLSPENSCGYPAWLARVREHAP